MHNIGIISNTRIEDEREKIPEKVKDAFKDVNLILHAGNLNKGFVLDALEEIAPTIAIQGDLDDLSSFSRQLPPFKILDVGDFKIGLFHEKPDMKMIKEKKINILIHGHDCIPKIQEGKDLRLILNPGTPFPKYSPKFNNGTIMLLKIKSELVFSYIIKV
ncbi:MAG: metallophosphoesterase family protein [Promethearchaeota archaeon]